MGWIDRLRGFWSGTLRTSSRSGRDPTEKLPATLSSLPSTTRGPAVAQPALPFPPNAALEEALLREPDSHEALLVYADWLQTQGHPAGELIALQCALAAPSSPAELDRLHAAEGELLARHAPALLGAFALRKDAVRLVWRGGFIRAARIAPTPAAEPELVRELLQLPCARLLEKLSIGGEFSHEAWQARNPHLPTGMRHSLAGVVSVLAETELPPTLRSLVFDAELSYGPIRELQQLYPRLSRLEHLGILSNEPPLGEIDLPALRELTLMGFLTLENLDSLARARCPELRRLDLQVHTEGYARAELLPMFQGACGKLTELVFRCPFTDEVGAALLDAPALAGRLERLTLAHELSDDGATTLAGSRSVFRALRRLDVAGNVLGRPGVIALRRAFGDSVELELKDQRQRYERG